MKVDHARMGAFSYARISRFCSCFLDLDPMTLSYELDLGIVKMYQRTKNEVSRSWLSKVRAQTVQTDTQTDTIETITTQHSRAITRLDAQSNVVDREQRVTIKPSCHLRYQA